MCILPTPVILHLQIANISSRILPTWSRPRNWQRYTWIHVIVGFHLTQGVSLHFICRGCIFRSSNRFRRVGVKILKDFKKISTKKIYSKVTKNRFEIWTLSQRCPNCEINEYHHQKQRDAFVFSYHIFHWGSVFQVQISNWIFDTLELIFLVEIFFKVL